jgi:hypothetical protein
MTDEQAIDTLAERFAALGAPDPRGWASSQLREGVPQLARFVFLREAWRRVVAEDDPSWIDDAVARFERDSDAPYAGAGRALKRLRALGADDRDLIDLVRATEAEFLFRLCHVLADPGLVDDPAAEGVLWAWSRSPKTATCWARSPRSMSPYWRPSQRAERCAPDRTPNVRWNWQGRYGAGGAAAASYTMPLQLNFGR